jgi:hypothetical protein
MLRFRLRFGRGAKPPFVSVRVEKAKDGRGYRVSAQSAVEAIRYIVKGLLMGPRTFTVTLVVPAPLLKGEARAALRAALPRLVADLRAEIEQRVKEALEKVKGHEVSLFKGQKSFIPGWAITARVLMCPERAQEEFDSWLLHHWSNYIQDKEKEMQQELDEEEDRLFLEGPHFGTLEERAEKILLKLLPEDRFELVEEEGGLGASLARPRRIKWEGIIAPLVQDGAEALRIIEDYQVLRAREIALLTTSPMLPVDLVRALYDGAYLAEVAVNLLNVLGLDWPTRIIGGKLPPVGGVHPLFVILEAARLEAAWGRLMDRLGSEDFDLLRAARKFQRLLGEGLSVEEALEALKGSVRGQDFPAEVALLLTGRLAVEFVGEDEEPLLELDEDTVLRHFQEEALEEALLAWGFKSPEEALEALEALGEDPLAQAFRADVQGRFEAKRIAVGM